MAVRDTSIDAYIEHEHSGELSRQQEQLLKVFQRGRDYSRAELSMMTGMRLASVCGRVNELVKLKRISEAPLRACKVTGRTIHPVFKVEKGS